MRPSTIDAAFIDELEKIAILEFPGSVAGAMIGGDLAGRFAGKNATLVQKLLAHGAGGAGGAILGGHLGETIENLFKKKKKKDKK